ncbi:SDR family NAD(P)-dependent oxidoreductase [Sneathiella chungangensis]|uniref:SDR family NAD(P)-dependent oxidoreductase n=1 Tax=Sneathiella chungangensis TaxID=1418234 RepID=A0A845MID1_9PROT|nr:3-hydroxyacyl-CoA dehydrogenase [Sneathiella chungangensis]MZR23362.1 SDR family NAD(P)-dependent oxidoreductase [Sneathiella chungangensis]
MDISGKSAIVTGGASGLGEATSRMLAAAGAKVAILDMNTDLAEKVANDIGGIACTTNVSDDASVDAAFEKARDAHGAARILVNCAGIGPAAKTYSSKGMHPLDKFEQVISVNLIGTFNCIRRAAADIAGLDPMESGERGVCINTASVAAFDGQIGQAAYSASKGGIVGMTLPIARDLASIGIRVVTIAPGLFETPLLKSLPEDVQAALGASVPFPSRLGHPSEYAALARQIMENQMLNGEVIRLDGAIRMAPK